MLNDEIPAVPKKKWSRRKKMIALCASLILFILIFTVLAYGIWPGGGCGEFGQYVITVNKGTTATTTIFTVKASPNSCYNLPLKSDVYVQVKDVSGTFKILTVLLSKATGTQGFNYSSSTGAVGQYISVGDVFSLNGSMYEVGSTLNLVNSDSTSQYCHLTV